MTDPRRSIPSVDRLLSSPAFAGLLTELPRDLVVARLQHEIDALRRSFDRGERLPERIGDPEWFASRVERSVRRLAAGALRPVINATGVILHTNLGRAPLADAALAAVQQLAAGYSSLEYDLETGGRGSRYTHCRDLLVHLTGAQDALVVNNNAAALVLALNTVARDLDAVISRGELVEIGGSFRIPEIMARSGARMREVGATNRTHAADYRAALSERTGALLKVHPSNFSIEGYTAAASIPELVAVAAEGGVPLIHDIGSGLLIDPARLGLQSEPTPQQSLREGVDLVTLSGDKLLGGPQCGIVLGHARMIERLRSNPLCRAFRVDKLTLAALTATLRIYLDTERALHDIPTLRMLGLTRAELEARATAFVAALGDIGITAETTAGNSAVGGGAAPAASLPTVLIALEPQGLSAGELERRLRAGDPPVIGRMIDGALVFDLRTVPPHADEPLLGALRRACTAT